MADTITQALRAARAFLATDRTALADAHMDPVTNTLDAHGAEAVAEFDEVLGQIDAALAAQGQEQAEPVKHERMQSLIDAFAKAHAPCCAGCDWWRWHNTLVGDCTKSAPVAGPERVAMLGMHGLSIRPESGHIMTLRDHQCGDFKDTQGATE